MNKNQNCAEAMDLMNSRIAVGFLIASLAYAIDAGSMLVAEQNQSVLNWASFAISMAAVLWIFRAIGPSLLKKLKNKSLIHHEPESFITDSLHQAINKSWMITLVVLMLLKSLDQWVIRMALPADFYFKSLIFVMLFSASVIFLIMTRSTAVEGTEELVK